MKLLPKKETNTILGIKTVVVTACALTLAACGKKQTSNAKSDPAMVLASAAQPAAGQVDSFMTDQLKIFIQQKGRLPQDFSELVRARLETVPTAPQGMKWTIDRATQEVKLVKSK